MNRFLLTAAALIGITTAVLAQSDPIAQRRNVMKGVGAATKLGGEMAKGEKPFDLAKAKEILETYAKAAATFHTYYPDTSKTGGETTAGPKIWESPAEFKAAFDTWAVDIKKAAADTTDLATFRASFGAVTKSCKGCHDNFRVKI